MQKINVNVSGNEYLVPVLLADDVTYLASNYSVSDVNGDPIDVDQTVDAALMASSRMAQELAIWNASDYFNKADGFIDFYISNIEGALADLKIQFGAQAVFDTAVTGATAVAKVYLGTLTPVDAATALVDIQFDLLDAESDLVRQTFYGQQALEMFEEARILIQSAVPTAAAIPQGLTGYETSDIEMQAAGDALNRGLVLYEKAIRLTVEWFEDISNEAAEGLAANGVSIIQNLISLIPNGGDVFGDVAGLVGKIDDVAQNAGDLQELVDYLDSSADPYAVEEFSYFSDTNQEVFATVSNNLDASGGGESTSGGPSGTNELLKVANEALINETTDGRQYLIKTSALSDGHHAVVYTDLGQSGDDTSGDAVYLRIVDEIGAHVSDEILVPTTIAGNQSAPYVETLSGGKFLVSWIDTGLGAGAVRYQIFANDGSRIGGEETLVETASLTQRSSPAEFHELSNGQIVATWADISGDGGDTSGTSIHATVLNSDGSTAVGPFQVNTLETGNQFRPSLTACDDGRFMVAWGDAGANAGDTSGNTNAGYGMRMRIFEADGTAVTPSDVLVHQSTSGPQEVGGIDTLANGNIVVTWADDPSSADSRIRGSRGASLIRTATRLQTNSSSTTGI